MAHTQSVGAALVSGSSSSRVVSATVVAAYHVHTGSAGAEALDVLVLLRGSPAWFNRTGRSGILSGGKSGTGTGHATASYWAEAGGITTTFETDSELATVHLSIVSSTMGAVFDRPIAPADTNVVLVDAIDRGGKPTVETRLIDPRLSGEGDTIASIVRRSPAIFEFLQCDVTTAAATVPDAPILGLRAMTPAVCNEMRPR